MIHWFGDSWTIGDGLARDYGKYSDQLGDSLQSLSYYHPEKFPKFKDFSTSRPDMGFPALVSKKLGVPFTLHGNRGESVSQMMCGLKWWLDDHDASGMTAIFAFPTQSSGRHFYIDNNYKTVQGSWRNVTPLCVDWQKTAGFFDTTVHINLIYTYCLVNNISPYFLCTWKPIKLIPEIDMVPPDRWLLPPSTTLAKKTFGEDTAWAPPPQYCVSKEDTHPNFIGQQKLADTLLPYINEII